jgi:hypothetical protein
MGEDWGMVETHGPRLAFKGTERWKGGVWSPSGISWRLFSSAGGASGEGRWWDKLERRRGGGVSRGWVRRDGENVGDGKKWKTTWILCMLRESVAAGQFRWVESKKLCRDINTLLEIKEKILLTT